MFRTTKEIILPTSSSSSSSSSINTSSSSSSSFTQPNKGTIFFIGNATMLIRYAGFTILTDPTFIHMHEKVNLGFGLYTKRLTNPALNIEQLPPLDLVILSHFHGDHFDQVAVRELDKSLRIVTTHATQELSLRGFIHSQRLDKW